MSHPIWLEGDSNDESDVDKAEIEAYKRIHGGDEPTIRANDGLKKSLESFKLGPLPFVETLSVSTKREEVTDAQDELSRELAFYQMAHAAMLQARKRLDDSGVKHRRSDTYFAEMVKNDKHMERIRDGLKMKQHRADESLKRQKLREIKRFSKEVQRTKVDEKQKKKKGEMEKLTRWRRDSKKGGASGEFDIEDIVGKDDTHAMEDRPRTRGKQVRKAKDQRYGFGGQKRGLKRNTSESAGSMADFSSKANRSTSFGGGRGGKRRKR